MVHNDGTRTQLVPGIEAHMRPVFNAWVESLTDEELKRKVKANSIIAGGAIVSLVKDEQPKDYDIFFTTLDTTLHVMRYYVNIVNSLKGENFAMIHQDGLTLEIKMPELTAHFGGQGEYGLKVVSPNCITLNNKIQLIYRYWGTPQDIINSFDFAHTHCFWEALNGKTTVTKEASKSITQNRLRYVGSAFPVNALMRLRRFADRGWEYSNEDRDAIIRSFQNIDFTNIEAVQLHLYAVSYSRVNDIYRRIQEAHNRGQQLTPESIADTIVNAIYNVPEGNEG